MSQGWEVKPSRETDPSGSEVPVLSQKSILYVLTATVAWVDQAHTPPWAEAKPEEKTKPILVTPAGFSATQPRTLFGCTMRV